MNDKSMTKDEALKLALDLATMHHTDEGYAEMRSKVRVAIKQALAQPVQEPVDNDFFKVIARNNPSPDKREWVGLTDEKIQAIHDTYYRRMGPQEFASMIDAKLKEKNT